MNIRQIRIANLLLLAIIIVSGHYNLLFYTTAMHVSLEVLNSRAAYLEHSYKLFNFLFWAYQVVLLERLRSFSFSPTAEWMINCAEHIAFGAIICLKVYMYSAIYIWKKDSQRLFRIVAAVLFFNGLGVFNEVFQNWLYDRDSFRFIDDSLKDLRMNLWGTALFFLTALIRAAVLQRKANAYF
jgi:hypothetical protein